MPLSLKHLLINKILWWCR